MNIVIINAYGYRNIGDEAILESALQFIKKHISKKDLISIHSEKIDSIPPLIKTQYNIKTFQLPYGYAIRSKKNKIGQFTKIIRFIEIFLLSFFYILMDYLQIKSLPRKTFYSYLKNIKDADVIIGMGGGYFISRHRVKDSFGLFLSLIPIIISKFYKKNILFLPISFGPFASSIHEKFTYLALQRTTIMSRDKITLKKIQSIDKMKKIRTFFTPDLALFYNWKKDVNIKKKIDSKFITITTREWLPPVQQKFYEQNIARTIDYFWKAHRLKTVFLVMANNRIEDNDNDVANRIKKYLKEPNIFSISSVTQPREAQNLLNDSFISICTRLHSAILSTTVYTPFITLAYTNKTHGFLDFFNLSEWNINVEDVRHESLIDKFEQLKKKHVYINFIDTLKKKRDEVEQYRTLIDAELNMAINKI